MLSLSWDTRSLEKKVGPTIVFAVRDFDDNHGMITDSDVILDMLRNGERYDLFYFFFSDSELSGSLYQLFDCVPSNTFSGGYCFTSLENIYTAMQDSQEPLFVLLPDGRKWCTRDDDLA